MSETPITIDEPDGPEEPGDRTPDTPADGAPDGACESALSVATSVRKFQKELSAGIVSLALLGLLARADKPLYGYQIAKELETFGPGLPVKQGTLYPVLRSLEAGRLLESIVEPSVAGPPRRYYSTTEEGRLAIGLWQESWIRTREFVDAVLEGHRG
jgi:PadR family transcriptional regulator, regulatory protein PadR